MGSAFEEGEYVRLVFPHRTGAAVYHARIVDGPDRDERYTVKVRVSRGVYGEPYRTHASNIRKR